MVRPPHSAPGASTLQDLAEFLLAPHYPHFADILTKLLLDVRTDVNTVQEPRYDDSDDGKHRFQSLDGILSRQTVSASNNPVAGAADTSQEELVDHEGAFSRARPASTVRFHAATIAQQPERLAFTEAASFFPRGSSLACRAHHQTALDSEVFERQPAPVWGNVLGPGVQVATMIVTTSLHSSR